jgi:integrase/recombinase XerD
MTPILLHRGRVGQMAPIVRLHQAIDEPVPVVGRFDHQALHSTFALLLGKGDYYAYGLRHVAHHLRSRCKGGARREEKEPNILYKEQYKALLYEASDNIRDYAIIMTFLQTGIRLSELVNLRVEDVDFEHRILTVRQGKGKKDRQIPLVDEAVKALRNYLKRRNTELIVDDEIFFLAKTGTSLNVSSVKYIVAKYVKKAGIRKKVSVHTLRHTFGAHKADKQMGIATLQALMGHKKKETTLKYIHLAKTNLRQEMVETAL